MIHSITFTRLTNAEFIQFNKNIADLILQKNPVTLKVEALYGTYTAKIAMLEDLFKNPTSSPITAEMEQLDLRRDEAINGITFNINSFSYHFDPEMRECAIKLQNNLKLYGSGIARENYQSETAVINNLVNDWETKPELTNAIDMLGLFEWKMELKTANTLFDEKYLNRAQSYASAPIETQKSQRQEVMATYYELRKCIEALALLTPSPLYDGLIREINEVIDLYLPLTRIKTKPATDPVSN